MPTRMVGNPIPIPTPMAILSEVESPSVDAKAVSLSGEGESGVVFVVVVVAVGDGKDVFPVLSAGVVPTWSTKVIPGVYDGVLATTVFF
jgi:hypothetical protein